MIIEIIPHVGGQARLGYIIRSRLTDTDIRGRY